jgi:hypothetical protein
MIDHICHDHTRHLERHCSRGGVKSVEVREEVGEFVVTESGFGRVVVTSLTIALEAANLDNPGLGKSLEDFWRFDPLP